MSKELTKAKKITIKEALSADLLSQDNQTMEMMIGLIRKAINSPYASNADIVFMKNRADILGLQPLNKEIYLIGYKNNKTGQWKHDTVIAYESYIKGAKKGTPTYQGYESGVEMSNGIPSKAWAKVYVEGYQVPIKAEVLFGEYKKSSPVWQSMPVAMIEKVAIKQAHARAYPELFAGVYMADEMPFPDHHPDNENEVIIESKVVETPPPPQPSAAAPVEPMKTMESAPIEKINLEKGGAFEPVEEKIETPPEEYGVPYNIKANIDPNTFTEADRNKWNQIWGLMKSLGLHFDKGNLINNLYNLHQEKYIVMPPVIDNAFIEQVVKTLQQKVLEKIKSTDSTVKKVEDNKIVPIDQHKKEPEKNNGNNQDKEAEKAARAIVLEEIKYHLFLRGHFPKNNSEVCVMCKNEFALGFSFHWTPERIQTDVLNKLIATPEMLDREKLDFALALYDEGKIDDPSFAEIMLESNGVIDRVIEKLS